MGGPMEDAPGPAPAASSGDSSPDAAEAFVESLSAPNAPSNPGVEQVQQYVKDYRDDPQDFDRMLITIWNYFELINQTSAKIEVLWLNILEVLQLERPNKYTVIKAVHHQAFRNIILKDPLIRQVITACEDYKDSGYAMYNPAKYLDRIYAIR